MRTESEKTELVDGYLRYLAHVRLPSELPDGDDGAAFVELMRERAEDNPHEEQWELFHELVAKERDAAWPLLLQVIERAEKQDRPAIAADALGTFVFHHAAAAADRLDAEIRQNDRFFRTFQFVKMTGVPLEIQQRLNRALLDRGADPKFVVEYDEEAD